MEQNTAQHTLTFSKGITSIPSDLLCPDDTLSLADGLILADGEYKAMQAPRPLALATTSVLKFVHELSSASRNYIFWDSDTHTLSYESDGTTDTITSDITSPDVSVTAIGNTLIVSHADGILYFRWKADEHTAMSYKPLPSSLPNLDVRFSLVNVHASLKESVKTTNNLQGNSGDNNGYHLWGDEAEYQNRRTELENAVLGVYNSVRAKADEKKVFCTPFFARAAVELYNGTYTHITNPVLLFPSVSSDHYNEVVDAGDFRYIYCHMPWPSTLRAMVLTDYSDYEDIISNVVVFISRPISLWKEKISDTISQWDPIPFGDTLYDTVSFYKDRQNIYRKTVSETVKNPANLRFLEHRDTQDIIEDLESSSVFFKLCELGIKPTDGWEDTRRHFRDTVLKNLETQTQLDADDYHSFCPLIADKAFTFNRRLNLTGTRRGFFEGFPQQVAYSYPAGEYAYSIFVYIRTDVGVRIVRKDITTSEVLPSTWFFYPDPRAYRAVIMLPNNQKVADLPLKEHPGLNGAYYIADALPTGSESSPIAISTDPIAISTDPEPLPNYLLQSEVDNPFVFLASGYVRVGQGTIIGIAGLTTALNQDAYMVATTLAFTTQGIWAISINGDGQYSGVHPPFSREVCNNPASITMTDNAVFFTSEKGLMCVTGTRETSVICVSDALRDSDFIAFCRTCRIAYDYKESLLLLYQPGHPRCYIYNIHSHAWTYDDSLFTGVPGARPLGGTEGVQGASLSGVEGVALRATQSDSVQGDAFCASHTVDYPDTLLQTGSGRIFSLLSRPNRDTDPNTYSGTLVSRPCKLDGSQVLKSLRQLKLLYDIDGSVTDAIRDGHLTLTIEGSNDCRTFHTLTSLRSKPFKFFRFRIDLHDLRATDTFTGLTLITQKRYTEKLI